APARPHRRGTELHLQYPCRRTQLRTSRAQTPVLDQRVASLEVVRRQAERKRTAFDRRLETLPQHFRDALGQIVGDAQVLTKETYFALDVAIEQRFAIATRDHGIHVDLCRAQHGGDLALQLASLFELLDRGVQRDQVGIALSGAI